MYCFKSLISFLIKEFRYTISCHQLLFYFFRFISKVQVLFGKQTLWRFLLLAFKFLWLYRWTKNIYPHSKAWRIEKKHKPCLQWPQNIFIIIYQVILRLLWWNEHQTHWYHENLLYCWTYFKGIDDNNTNPSQIL